MVAVERDKKSQVVNNLLRQFWWHWWYAGDPLVLRCTTQYAGFYLFLGKSSLNPSNSRLWAGLRNGTARPRDQPSGSVQVRCPSKDRPQPVERRFLPLSSLPELPQRLREEVEALLHFHPALVRSSQPPFLLLVRHARTLSPMSDTLVVYIIWTNMPCPLVFHRHTVTYWSLSLLQLFQP